jgi:hypothetical protein
MFATVIARFKKEIANTRSAFSVQFGMYPWLWCAPIPKLGIINNLSVRQWKDWHVGKIA